jgi:Cytochrome P460
MSRNATAPLLISSLGLVMAIGLFVSYFGTQSCSSASAHAAVAAGDPVNEIAGYRNWSKVNPEPLRMADRTAFLCAAPAAVPPADPKNPHTNKYITVYVNDLGRKAMLEQKSPDFPEGSVIVKEKLSERSSPAPELLTVMIKRGQGFNPASGDWEYMALDGTGTRVLAEGKLENCQSCHSAKPETDYVFRTYLPYEVQTKLK